MLECWRQTLKPLGLGRRLCSLTARLWVVVSPRGPPPPPSSPQTHRGSRKGSRPWQKSPCHIPSRKPRQRRPEACKSEREKKMNLRNSTIQSVYERQYNLATRQVRYRLSATPKHDNSFVNSLMSILSAESTYIVNTQCMAMCLAICSVLFIFTNVRLQWTSCRWDYLQPPTKHIPLF